MAENLAIDGYDVVAYTAHHRPVAGSSNHTYEWDGRTWRFESANHRDSFAQDPARYVPQYDGNCAFAMSLGKSVPGSPRTWRIIEGKLYLQANPVAKFLFGVIPGRREAAERNWRQQDPKGA